MHLFAPLQLRDVTLRNRIGVSPMCQYSCEGRDGMAGDWHLVHLGSRAAGGAGLVTTEAAAVTAVGRISPEDLGIWDDAHVEPLERVTRFIRARGAVPGIQLAHAGRKGSTYRNWAPQRGAVPPEEGGWVPVAPSPVPFGPRFAVPRPLEREELPGIARAFRDAAERALRAGFDVIELHAAHGYLLHTFLSPLTNARTDDYGGSFANRVRLTLETVEAIRSVWPERLPLLVRLSVTDWAESGGWDVEQSVALARLLRERAVDVIDCSSGSLAPELPRPEAPGYLVPFAGRIRAEAEIGTAAVGVITEPHQADEIVRGGRADLVLLARAMLLDPYWPLHAALALGVPPDWPSPYLRARELAGAVGSAPPQPAGSASATTAQAAGPGGPSRPGKS